MKKLILLVFTLAIIPLAEAVTFFGKEISILLVLPLVLIVVFLVLFASKIIWDKMKIRSSIKDDTELGDIPTPDSLGDLTKEELTEKQVKEKPKDTLKTKEQQQTKEQLQTKEQAYRPKRDYLKVIEEFEKKAPSMDITNIRKQLVSLIKDFFSDYAGINYNFTFEELEDELRKKNENIMFFSENLSYLNYGPEEVSRRDLINLIKEFKDIVMSILEKTQPITPEFRKEDLEKKHEINKLIKKGGKLIGLNIVKAVEKYAKIYDLYGTLTNEEKSVIRPMIMDFYNQLIRNI